MEWRVKLSGDRLTLEQIQEQLKGEEYQIIEDQGQFYLVSPSFNEVLGHAKIKEKAEIIINRLNGFLKLVLGLSSQLSISGVERCRDNGKTDQFIYLEPIILEIKVMTPKIPGSETHKSKLAKYLILAERNENIALLSEILAIGNDFPSIDKLIEIIEEDVGDLMFRLGWISKKKVKLIRRIANNARVLRGRARHAKLEWEPPGEKISLEEAKRLIFSLVEKWLAYKYNQLENK